MAATSNSGEPFRTSARHDQACRTVVEVEAVIGFPSASLDLGIGCTWEVKSQIDKPAHVDAPGMGALSHL
jgi:hypothetical protein